MPTDLEVRLQAEAEERWPGDRRRQQRYVYGALRASGWRPDRERPRRPVLDRIRRRKRHAARP